MKILKIIFFSLLALSLIACTAIFIFFQTFDTDQYLPQIIKKASLALGRPVSIGHVGLGLSSRGITLDAGPVTIADDPGFTTQPFIKIDMVRVSLDLRSLILQRKIYITGILLRSPQIHFIRSQEGNINIRNIGRAVQSSGDNTAVLAVPKGEAMPQENDPRSSYRTFPDGRNGTIEHIKSIKIQDASISFIDQNQTFPIDIWLTGIDASLNDFSLSKPFQLSFDACFYSNTPNVHANTFVSLDLFKRAVQITGLRLDTALSRLDVDWLKGISPEMPESSTLRNIAGNVGLNIVHLDTGTSGGITANGGISITGGVIRNFNIIKTLLSHTLGAFGGKDGNIDNLLNGQLKSKLGADDTTIEKAQAQISFHDKTFFIDDSLVQTNIFELSAKGTVDMGLNMDMQTMLHLNNDVSAALVNELEGLKYLYDDSDRIAIGASLKGVIPHLKYKPNKDFRKKSKRMMIEEGGNILGVLLGGGKI
jgi:hypothetical protein